MGDVHASIWWLLVPAHNRHDDASSCSAALLLCGALRDGEYTYVSN